VLADILSIACLRVFAIVRIETDIIYFLRVCDQEKVTKIDESEIFKHHAFFMHTRISLNNQLFVCVQHLNFFSFRFTRSVSLPKMKDRGSEERRTTLQKMFSLSFIFKNSIMFQLFLKLLNAILFKRLRFFMDAKRI
jgi:hypothetical protein